MKPHGSELDCRLSSARLRLILKKPHAGMYVVHLWVTRATLFEIQTCLNALRGSGRLFKQGVARIVGYIGFLKLDGGAKPVADGWSVLMTHLVEKKVYNEICRKMCYHVR